MRIKFPLKIEFEITTKCNMHCKHCMLQLEPSEELSKDVIVKHIDNWVASGLLELQFTGGEPFLREDMVELVEYATQKGLKVLISTNGTLITEEASKRLAKTGAYIEISLDGSTETVHDAIRGKGAFYKTCQGIDLLKRYGNKIMIETVVQRDNMHDLENIHALAVRLGAYRHLFHSLRYSRPDLRAMGLSKEEMEACQKRIFDIKASSRIQVQPPYLPVDCYIKQNGAHIYERKVFGCGALKFKCGVSPNGDVWPCLLFGEHEAYQLGNITENSISELWNKEKTINIYHELHDVFPVQCSNCFAKEHCDGGCRKVSYTFFGEIGKQDISCPYSPEH